MKVAYIIVILVVIGLIVIVSKQSALVRDDDDTIIVQQTDYSRQMVERPWINVPPPIMEVISSQISFSSSELVANRKLIPQGGVHFIVSEDYQNVSQLASFFAQRALAKSEYDENFLNRLNIGNDLSVDHWTCNVKNVTSNGSNYTLELEWRPALRLGDKTCAGGGNLLEHWVVSLDSRQLTNSNLDPSFFVVGWPITPSAN